MSALKAVATAEHLNAHQTCATFARSDVPVGTSLFVATPPAEPGAVHCDCVIAFREGKREPEFVSWNKLPIGEHRMVRVPNLPEPGAGELSVDLVVRGLNLMVDHFAIQNDLQRQFNVRGWPNMSAKTSEALSECATAAATKLTQAQAKIARLEEALAFQRITSRLLETRALRAEADAAKLRGVIERARKALENSAVSNALRIAGAWDILNQALAAQTERGA